MELAAVLSTALAGAAVLYAVVFLLPRLRRRHGPPVPPGLGGLPVVGHLPFLDLQLHTYFTRLAAAYGPIFSLRLGSMLNVVVSSPELAREILREDSTFANLAPESGLVITAGADILWSPAGPMWRMLRRACAQEMLTPAGLAAMAALRRRELRATVAQLHARAGTAVDLRSVLFMSACNVMTSMVWGSTLEASPSPALVPGRKEFREFIAEIVDISGWPNVSDYFPALAPLDLQGIRRRMEAHKRRLDDMFDKIIDERRRQAEGKTSPAPAAPEVLDLFPLFDVAPSLSDILGCGEETSSAAAGGEYGTPEGAAEDEEEEELARRALRGRERWVYCHVSESPSASDEAASAAPPAYAFTGTDSPGGGSLWLKLDYAEVLTAWSDRGARRRRRGPGRAPRRRRPWRGPSQGRRRRGRRGRHGGSSPAVDHGDGGGGSGEVAGEGGRARESYIEGAREECGARQRERGESFWGKERWGMGKG